jgi:hypothetical protein
MPTEHFWKSAVGGRVVAEGEKAEKTSGMHERIV